MSDARIGEDGTTWSLPFRVGGTLATTLTSSSSITMAALKPSGERVTVEDTGAFTAAATGLVAYVLDADYLPIDTPGTWWLQLYEGGRASDWIPWEVA